MKERLIKFIKDFEDNLARELYNKWQDLQYYKYCLEQKSVCLQVKEIINNNTEEELYDKLKEYETELRKEGSSAKINMISYILKELDK